MEDSLLNDLRKKITQYFDHQMNQDDEKEFLHQISKYPEGEDVFRKEKNIRNKIKEKLYRPHHTRLLEDQIKNRIKGYPH